MLCLVLGLLGVACQGEGLTVIPASELPGDVYSPPAPGLDELPPRGTVYLVREEQLLPVSRRLPRIASSLTEASVLALLRGADTPEGATTAIPVPTRLIGVRLNDRVATVDLSREFEQGGTGQSLALRVAQVVYTVTEDPTVVGVLFSIEGTPTPVVARGNRVVSRPVSRRDYEPFAPPG